MAHDKAAPCARGTLTGEVTYVRDGDTIEVGGLPIRLNGLAAPEGDERGGSKARRAMKELVLGEEVRCVLDGEKKIAGEHRYRRRNSVILEHAGESRKISEHSVNRKHHTPHDEI